jgi:dolichol-phosphate mannosyltransferase
MNKPKLTVVIPCYNEERTLKTCVERVLRIAEESLSLEIIIVDDCSKDRTLSIARTLEETYPEIKVVIHEVNRGKGAALRTGFAKATGEFIAVQDADLEYDPRDLRRLVTPLIADEADVVLGSRFLSSGAHRVLYFWHYLGNRFLTFLSNMFTDLNLTDMETCYKVFRRDVIQSIDIKENRFGFEPEIVAKVAHMRLRIAALFNLIVFLGMLSSGWTVTIAAPTAFILAAIANYLLCILLLFRHKARWNSINEMIIFWFVVGVVGILDLATTKFFILLGIAVWMSKLLASIIGLIFNFIGRRFLVFSEPPSGPWRAQTIIESLPDVEEKS